MPEPAPLPVYELEEYVALEQGSDTKHEFIDGVIVAMVGASKSHDVIVNNLQRLIGNHLQGTPCRVAGSDLKLRVEATNRVFYPDLMVLCSDPLAGDPFFETDARLVIEVLSNSTAKYDLDERSRTYRLVPSLGEYVSVAPDRMHVTRVRREGHQWISQAYRPADCVPLLDGELTIPVSAIYERLSLA